MTTITLISKQDPSVNTVLINGYESRFVVRDHTPIIYLSSFNGCDKACRMCWLTQNNQTDMVPADLDMFIEQARCSLEHAEAFFKDQTAPQSLHFNFMARGEPLVNPTVMGDWETLSKSLIEEAEKVFPGVLVKFKISTIMPHLYDTDENGTVTGGYTDIPFTTNHPEIYYSLYSVQTAFRKRWLPNTQEPKEALRLLSSYSRKGGSVWIHGAFIEGHNDSLVSINDMIRAIKHYNTTNKFNIVRFNSPDESKWVEPTEEWLEEIVKFMERQGLEVQMVPRVGHDVAASCGMFYEEPKA